MLSANHPFFYYYTITKADTSSADVKNAYKADKAKTIVSANEKKQLTIKNIPDKDFQVWVYFKMNDGTMKYSRIPLSADWRPDKSNEISKDAHIYTVNDCKVSGLKKPLKFYPNKFYSFKAIGAGTEIVKPVARNEKYETLYWSTSKTPTEHVKNRTWKIGSAKGVTNASTYTMYVFFQKYRFDGNGWIPGDIEYKSVFWL